MDVTIRKNDHRFHDQPELLLHHLAAYDNGLFYVNLEALQSTFFPGAGPLTLPLSLTM
jgi:hypothetical protein